MRRLLLAVLLAAACASPRDRARAADRSPVVARVDGEAITAREVELVARSERLAPRDALERCVRDRLLVREGLRRGLVNRDDEENAEWHASVQLLLARDVEDRESPGTIPGSFFEEFYQLRRVEFSHDGLVATVHALAEADADAGVAARERARDSARRFHEQLVATAGPRPTQQQFEALAGQLHMRFESVAAFDRTGQGTDGARFADAYVRAAWALSDEAPLSGPFETPFGAHVALRVGATPPLARPRDEVRAIIVRDGVNLRRRRAMASLLERLRARGEVRVSEGALAARPHNTAGAAGASRP